MKINLLLSLLILPSVIFSQTRRDFTFKFDGVDRTFIAVRPSGTVPAGGYPVVLMLHGTSGDGEKFYNISGWKEKGESEKFITVFPTSLEYCILNFPNNNPIKLTKWNNGDLQEVKCPNIAQDFKDDIKFIRKIVDTIRQTYNINTKKVFASGFSNGCSMIHKLAMDASDIFAAVAGGSAILHPLDSVKPLKRIPVWNIIGNLDDRLLAATGRASISVESDSILLLMNAYLKRMQVCEGLTNVYTKTITTVGNTYTYKTPVAGESPNTFVFSFLKDLTHEYPNGLNYPMSAANVFWEFFKQSVATDVKDHLLIPEHMVSIYPNPSNTIVNVDLSALTEGGALELSVYNIFGQQVKNYKNQHNSIVSLDKNDIGKGLFVLKIQQGDKILVKKFVFE